LITTHPLISSITPSGPMQFSSSQNKSNSINNISCILISNAAKLNYSHSPADFMN